MYVMRKKRNRHEIDFLWEHRIFAVGTLEALIEAGHEVALVVTQPDKPRGRSKNCNIRR